MPPLAHGEQAGLPPFDLGQLVGQTRLDPLLAVGLALAAGIYLWGVRELRARGDRWPGGRSAAWLGGLGIVAVATMSGLGAYDETLFSAHMVQHMLLSMVAPIFLALGAPVTLALRTLRPAGRRMLLAVVHSRVARVLTFPPLDWLLFVGSPFALYFSGWYPATLDHRWLHELLHVHFLLVGCLFFWPLVGLDPLPGRLPHPARFLLVFAALPMHAILGLSIMNMRELLAADHYGHLGLDWLDPLADQQLGGALLWASGDLVGLLMLGAVLVQWMRASDREAVRVDRQLDREQRARAAAGSPADEVMQPVWWELPARSSAPSSAPSSARSSAPSPAPSPAPAEGRPDPPAEPTAAPAAPTGGPPEVPNGRPGGRPPR